MQFYLVSLTYRSTIMGKMHPLINIIILVTLISILVTGTGSVYIARYVLVNIQSLNAYMHDISRGDLTIRTCVSGKDEFLELNSYMNKMVQTLSQQIESQKRTNLELAEMLEGFRRFDKEHKLISLGFSAMTLIIAAFNLTLMLS